MAYPSSPSIIDMETGEILPVVDKVSAYRETIQQIHEHINTAREKLYWLYTNEAWRELGYASWHELLSKEFGKHHSYLRRMTHAALIEANVGVAIGTHRESHLRAISEVLDDEDLQREAYQQAIDSEATTARDFRRESWRVYVDNSEAEDIKARLQDGLISPAQAYGLVSVWERAGSAMARNLISKCSDPSLAMMIKELGEHARGSSTFQEIAVTGAVPGLPEPIPLHEATASNLRAWLDVASAEHRAIAVELNRERYKELDLAVNNVISASRELVDALGVASKESFALAKALQEYDATKKRAEV